jgi:hypothetical protein
MDPIRVLLNNTADPTRVCFKQSNISGPNSRVPIELLFNYTPGFGSGENPGSHIFRISVYNCSWISPVLNLVKTRFDSLD